jgi:hypothetical protein
MAHEQFLFLLFLNKYANNNLPTRRRAGTHGKAMGSIA